MKKSKIICLALAILSLLVSAIFFSASATDDTELTIVSKNVSYDNNLKFVVAVPKSAVDDTLTFSVKYGERSYNVTKSVSELESDGIKDPTIDGVECYAIMSNLGVSFKNMSREYVLSVSSGEKTFEINYSMAEYLYESLFKKEIALAQAGTDDAARSSLYFSTLATGANAERVLYNLNGDDTDNITTFVDEYIYSNVTGIARLYKPGDTISVTEYTSVYRFEKSGDVWTKTEVVLAPGNVTVDAHMLLTGKSCVTDFEDGSVTGSYLTQKDNDYATYTVTSDDAPALSDGKVLEITHGNVNNGKVSSLELSPMYSNGGSVYVLDFDAYIVKPAIYNTTQYYFGINFGGNYISINGYGTNTYNIRVNGTDTANQTGYVGNEWGSYRFVFNVADSGTCRMYVYTKSLSDGSLTHVYSANLAKTISSSGVDKIGITHDTSASNPNESVTYYLDNLSFMRTDDTDSYVPFEWSGEKSMSFVTEDTTGTWIDSFKTNFKKTTAVALDFATTVADNTLVIGNVDCSIANMAYELLNQYLAEYDYEDEAGYVIYVMDGSIAVAYNSSVARTAAVSRLLSLASETDLRTLSGVIGSDVYSLVERAESSRKAMHQAQLDEIARQLAGVGRTDSAVIRAELERFFSYYDTNIITWLANLYDKDVGGFYFSNSARDTIGYQPDVESTAMAFKLMDDGGLFNEFGGLSEHGIPDFMKEPMTNWILGMQDPDGYFYHPQWGKEGSGDVRKGRDIDSVVYLLNRLGVKETYYSIPGHPEFKAVGAPSPASAVALTSPLKRGKISAVASVVATASIALPSYLQTPDAWRAYLDGLNINGAEKSYPVGNWLCSTVGTVREADIQWKEKTGEKAVFSTIALEFLNETQIPEIGLWERNDGSRKNDMDPGDGIGYNGTNGLMKISVAYSGYNSSRTSEGLSVIPMNNAYNALQSAVKVAKYGEDPKNSETVCYLLNNWTCISSTLSNINKNDPDNYPKAKELVLSNLADMIRASTTLLADHHLEGGGFKYYEESPCNAGNGTPLAYSPVPEADINAVTVCTTSTISNIFGTLRTLIPSIKHFRLWCAEDYYIFMNELENVSAVVKTVPDAERVTFDDYVYDEESTSQNVSNPSDLVYIGNINENYHSSTVVDSTNPNAQKDDQGNVIDKMLRLETFGIVYHSEQTETGGSKRVYDAQPGGPMSAYATFANALDDSIVHECYLFEADICITGKQDDTPVQISFVDPLNNKWISGFSIRTRTSSLKVNIHDGYPGHDKNGSGLSDDAAHYTGFNSGEWFKLTMKLYKFKDESNTLQVMTKIYINDVFLYETDCAQFGTSNNTTNIGRVRISSERSDNNVICLDNILCEKLDEAFVSESN